MLNEIKIAGLLSKALLPSRRDRDRLNTVRLPWWVSEDIASFSHTPAMAVNASVESDFLVVRSMAFPGQADEGKHLFYKFLDVVMRMVQMPQRIKDAQA